MIPCSSCDNSKILANTSVDNKDLLMEKGNEDCPLNFLQPEVRKYRTGGYSLILVPQFEFGCQGYAEMSVVSIVNDVLSNQIHILLSIARVSELQSLEGSLYQRVFATLIDE
ncbi:hypothetical protein STEG23_035742 [Scotinomys teguina]